MYYINSFHANGFFLNLLKTSESVWTLQGLVFVYHQIFLWRYFSSIFDNIWLEL